MLRCNSDVVIAAENTQFGLPEVNWGILPAGNVSQALAETMRTRDALCYIMTGELFDSRKAAEMGLVNEAVPKEKLPFQGTQVGGVWNLCPRALRGRH